MLTFIKSLFNRSTTTDDQLHLSDQDQATLHSIDDKIVVGKILSIRPHSNEKMTKVQVTKCDLGNGKTEQILCGGTNIAEGMIVPVATIDTDLGGGFIIGERDIRGEASRGMICAKAELGLKDHDEKKGEIWPLPSSLEVKLGTKVNQL